jgi:glycerate kinase
MSSDVNGESPQSQAMVIVAPDSFKGSLSAREAAAAIARGWRAVRPDDRIVEIPQSDGGEGTLDTIEAIVPGSIRHRVDRVSGPDGRLVSGEWLQLPGGAAVVELAQTSGLPLMVELAPLTATSRGMGEVIAAALEFGATSLIVGLGGSASTDAGMGALRALGLDLRDAGGRPLAEGGEALNSLASVNVEELLTPPEGGVILLTDVNAPLLGAEGAAAVFGPQKGANDRDIDSLEKGLTRAAEFLGGVPAQPGAGAAGGAAYGLVTLWGATVVSGSDYMRTLSGLDGLIGDADYVITGEGRFDAQSLTGKVVGRLLDASGRTAAHAIVIAGQVEVTTDRATTYSLSEYAGSVARSVAEPASWLAALSARAAADVNTTRSASLETAG